MSINEDPLSEKTSQAVPVEEVYWHLDLSALIEGQGLILVGWLFDLAGQIRDLELVNGEYKITGLLARATRLPRSDVSAHFGRAGLSDHRHGFVLCLPITTSDTTTPWLLNLVYADQTHAFHLSWDESDTVQTIDIHKKFWADALLKQAQANAPALLAGVLAAYLPPPEKLHVLVRGCIDFALWVPNEGLFITGWLATGTMPVTALWLNVAGQVLPVAPEQLVWTARADVSRLLQEQNLPLEGRGFCTLIPLPGKEIPDGPVRLVIRLENDEQAGMHTNTIEDLRGDAIRMTQRILSGFSLQDERLRTILDRHIGPAVQGIWRARVRPPGQVHVCEFGTVPVAPITSVIVPLYGRFDFAEYQLALFANDPDFQRCELIYVVDDPRHYETFIQTCQQIQPIYRVPFKTIYAEANLGYAGANNLGASIATGELLLLLNSDVMPREIGWLGKLETCYRSLNDVGALGPKLLFEDGSLQHAGMVFERSAEYGDIWLNRHPYRGQPDWDTQAILQSVPAVTGACLLLARALYEHCGGLDEDYILGDFEDSDLCLKLIEAGRRNYYLPDVALYHLERQSLAPAGNSSWRQKLTIYNGWQHTSRWDSVISGLMVEAV